MCIHYVHIYYTLEESIEYDETEKITKVDSDHPYILRVDHDDNVTFCVIVEREILTESNKLVTAINVMMAAYYVFNIKYNRDLAPVYKYLQHYLFKLPEKKLPVRVAELHSLISKQQV